MSRVIRMLAAAAAVGGLALGGLMMAGAASATSAGPATHGPGLWHAGPGTSSPAVGRSATAATSNRTFAGYQTAVPAGSATVATASFTVPTLSCSPFARGITASAGVLANNYRTASVAYVFIGCVNGKAVYYPGVLVNGKETDNTSTPFAAGDVINLTTKVSTNRTRVIVTDVTTGVTLDLRGAGARASAAYFGNDAWFTSTSTPPLHVPDFGKVTFKNCLIDGKTLGSWHPRAYQRVNGNGTVQIATGGFWPGGTAFSTRFMHS